MSEEMEDGKFEALEPAPTASETDGAGVVGLDDAGASETDGGAASLLDEGGASPLDEGGASPLDEVWIDLLAAIEELGLGSRDPEDSGSPAAGCYLSSVRMDRHGHGGVVVGWLFRDSVVPGEKAPLAETESVDILNEALGPLLLTLGFPIEPYAVDGRWIVTGARRAN
jgi:hypothetical protein